MAPIKPRKSPSEDGDDARKCRSEDRSATSSKQKSAATPNTPPKGSFEQLLSQLSALPFSSQHSRQLPIRGNLPAKPLNLRQKEDRDQHQAQLKKDAARKKAEEETAWMRRTGRDRETGEQRKPQSTGSSSSDSPIRRVESPPRYPTNWTEEEKTNAENLTKEGVKVAVYEQHRLDKDQIVRHPDNVTVAWDGCKNIDIPWHRFKIRASSVGTQPRHPEDRCCWIYDCTNFVM
jgi:eukaryotic translation initiation factor 2C